MHEITDAHAPEGHDPSYEGEVHWYRPDQTVEDWIARGNPMGAVEITEMAKIKFTYGELCPQKGCGYCSEDPTDVQQFAHVMRQTHREYLQEWGVEWDPTITF